MNALLFVAIFTGLLFHYGNQIAVPTEAQARGRADAVAANLAVLHQAAVRWTVSNGGAGYTGPVTNADIAPFLPSWYAQIHPWVTQVVAGRVVTCLASLPPGFETGGISAALWRRSLEDVGAGHITAGAFQSSSRVGTSLNGPAAGCANGSVAYVTQL
jgi:hypothetical protein